MVQVSPWPQLLLINTHSRCTAPHSRKNLAQLGCTWQGYHRAFFLQRNSSINILSECCFCLRNIIVFSNCVTADWVMCGLSPSLATWPAGKWGALWVAQAVVCSFVWVSVGQVFYCASRCTLHVATKRHYAVTFMSSLLFAVRSKRAVMEHWVFPERDKNFPSAFTLILTRCFGTFPLKSLK